MKGIHFSVYVFIYAYVTLCFVTDFIMANDFIKVQNQQVEGFTKSDEGEWNEPYIFIFAADPQPGLVDMVNDGDGSKWDVEINRTKQVVAAINKMNPQPKFLLIGGDIVNAFPATQYRSQQVADVKEAFSTLNSSIPILVISGNHDVGNIPTVDTMAEYRSDFGDEYYSFWVGGVFYIALNTQCFFDSSETEDICNQQEEWLQSQLEIAKNSSCKHVVVFMHIPLFIENANEGNTYYSIPKTKRLEMLEQFADAGIKKVFSGHYHRNGGGKWTKNGGQAEIQVIVSSAIGAQLGSDQAGINVVKVTENDISYQYFSIPDIPESVQIE